MSCTGILETGVVSEGKDIIKNHQVSNGTTNPAKWVSCAWYMGQLSHMLLSYSISRPTSKSCSAVHFIIVKCIKSNQNAYIAHSKNEGLRYIT